MPNTQIPPFVSVSGCTKIIYLPAGIKIFYGLDLSQFTYPVLGAYYAITSDGTYSGTLDSLYVYNGSVFVKILEPLDKNVKLASDYNTLGLSAGQSQEAFNQAVASQLSYKLDKPTSTGSYYLTKIVYNGKAYYQYNSIDLQPGDIPVSRGTFISASAMYESEGNKIGINTKLPQEALDVNGNVKATGFKKANGTPNQALTANGGVFDLSTKADLVDGKVPSSQLPSYVDDVLEFANLASFPATGENGKIYIAIDTNITYRWTGNGYAEISASLALGETSSTAYRGDRGKIAYDHSQVTHDKTLVGLGNVDNTSDLNKPISNATQTALNGKQNLLSSYDESILIENDGNIEGNVSLFEEYFEQQVCTLNFTPIQIIGVYLNGVKQKPSLYTITLPKTISLTNFTSGDYIEIQYTKLKI